MPKNVQKLIYIFLTGFCCLFVNACDTDSAATAIQNTAVYSVKAQTVQIRDVIQSFSLNGRVYAYARADVRPQVSGVVKERLFVEGSLVKKGEPLYQIDDALYKA